jgi:chaperone required for assembly of F1-ATPase
VQRQCDAWDPLLAWAGQRIGAGFRTASGIVHIAQDDAVAAGFAGLLADLPALQLTALHVMTTLTGSAVLAYAHAAGRIDADTAWAAAHVDEDWQIAQWGEDAEAAERRRLRRIELQAASRIWALGG